MGGTVWEVGCSAWLLETRDLTALPKVQGGTLAEPEFEREAVTGVIAQTEVPCEASAVPQQAEGEME